MAVEVDAFRWVLDVEGRDGRVVRDLLYEKVGLPASIDVWPEPVKQSTRNRQTLRSREGRIDSLSENGVQWSRFRLAPICHDPLSHSLLLRSQFLITGGILALQRGLQKRP